MNAGLRPRGRAINRIINASGVGIIGNGVLSTRSLFQKHGKRLLVAVTLIHQEHQAGRI